MDYCLLHSRATRSHATNFLVIRLTQRGAAFMQQFHLHSSLSLRNLMKEFLLVSFPPWRESRPGDAVACLPLSFLLLYKIVPFFSPLPASFLLPSSLGPETLIMYEIGTNEHGRPGRSLRTGKGGATWCWHVVMPLSQRDGSEGDTRVSCHSVGMCVGVYARCKGGQGPVTISAAAGLSGRKRNDIQALSHSDVAFGR